MRAFELGSPEGEAAAADLAITVPPAVSEAEDEGSTPGFAGIIGRHRRMHAVFDVIRRVAGTNATVLVTGESGTGKELVAQAIHARSRRRMQRLVRLI
jgi:transcriptional regulator with GAF, ATPase, and Fis domain